MSLSLFLFLFFLVPLLLFFLLPFLFCPLIDTIHRVIQEVSTRFFLVIRPVIVAFFPVIALIFYMSSLGASLFLILCRQVQLLKTCLQFLELIQLLKLLNLNQLLFLFKFDLLPQPCLLLCYFLLLDGLLDGLLSFLILNKIVLGIGLDLVNPSHFIVDPLCHLE